MSLNRLWLPTLISCATLASSAMAEHLTDYNALATPYSTAMTEQQAGDIYYITGGIGEEERAKLTAMHKYFNVHIISAAAGRGEYVDEVQYRIYDEADDSDQPILTAPSQGPYFYADLPDGRYTIEADHNDQTQEKTIRVGPGHPAEATFYWH